MNTNNPPFKIVALTQEQYEFLLNNCDVNIEFGLKSLQMLETKEAIEKMVVLMESFKAVKKSLKEAE